MKSLSIWIAYALIAMSSFIGKEACASVCSHPFQGVFACDESETGFRAVKVTQSNCELPFDATIEFIQGEDTVRKTFLHVTEAPTSTSNSMDVKSYWDDDKQAVIESSPGNVHALITMYQIAQDGLTMDSWGRGTKHLFCRSGQE